jgi:hypothetical protein
MRHSADSLKGFCQESFGYIPRLSVSTWLSVTFPSDVTNCQAAEESRTHENSG